MGSYGRDHKPGVGLGEPGTFFPCVISRKQIARGDGIWSSSDPVERNEIGERTLFARAVHRSSAS